ADRGRSLSEIPMKTLPSLALALALPLAALPARADPPPPGAVEARSAALDARIGALFAVGSGLTAAEVASRAAATSFHGRAKKAEVEAANAAVDQAIVGSLPRLSLTGRYLRLSSIDGVSLTLASAPTATPGRPITVTPSSPLVAIPFDIQFFPNQTVLHAN